ncbi:MAG TPA: amino acid-binding protein [Candidatus Limnocylindria bacterium]|nr:amino acid-binding protein [Candidatus Limnocylindria bacterium]
MNFEVQRQITVAIENQPGRLAAIATALAAAGVNIKDLSILDNIEQGVIRMITSDPVRCKALLAEQGFHPVEAEILVVDLQDTPGKLAVLADALAQGGVNIDYAYGSEGPSEQRMRVVVKASPLARACEIITSLRES